MRFAPAICPHMTVLFFALATAGGPAAAKVVIIGDSLGEGVGMVSHQTSLAQRSVQIKSAAAMSQLARAPAGALAVVVLGTNDAVGNLSGVDRAIDRFLATAEEKNIRLVWVGPPCVTRKWERSVVVLDQMLAKKMTGRGTYISLADASYCSNHLRAGDGVHFTMAGYQQIWSLVEASDPSGFGKISGPVTGGGSVTQAPQSDAKTHGRARIAGTSPVVPATGRQGLLPNGTAGEIDAESQAVPPPLGQIAPARGRQPWSRASVPPNGPMILPDPVVGGTVDDAAPELPRRRPYYPYP